MLAGRARSKTHILISRWNLLSCHGISSVQWGIGRSPKSVRLFNCSVTAVSVKKAFMYRLQWRAARDEVEAERQ
jgi:hypothetical protein